MVCLSALMQVVTSEQVISRYLCTYPESWVYVQIQIKSIFSGNSLIIICIAFLETYIMLVRDNGIGTISCSINETSAFENVLNNSEDSEICRQVDCKRPTNTLIIKSFLICDIQLHITFNIHPISSTQ